MPCSQKFRFYVLAALIAFAALSEQARPQAALNTSIKGEGHHCWLMQGNPFDDTVGCLVWDGKPFGDSEARQLEVYRKGQLLMTIEPGDPIREWHFWEHGRRMAVAFGAVGAPARFALFDLASHTQVDQAASGAKLPQWAKSQSQRDDESVPESPENKQERTLWIAKVLRGLDGVRVGIRRRDLAAWLTQEGGVSFRDARTYVSLKCPYIKVDVKFKAVGEGSEESPEDLVMDVSKPYLAWSVRD